MTHATNSETGGPGGSAVSGQRLVSMLSHQLIAQDVSSGWMIEAVSKTATAYTVLKPVHWSRFGDVGVRVCPDSRTPES